MDERYVPLAGGGNPCTRAVADLTHRCNLCTTALGGDPWDHGIAPGLRVLWSYPGAAGHAIDPAPLDVYAAFQADRLRLHVDSPAGLDLRGQVCGRGGAWPFRRLGLGSARGFRASL